MEISQNKICKNKCGN